MNRRQISKSVLSNKTDIETKSLQDATPNKQKPRRRFSIFYDHLHILFYIFLALIIPPILNFAALKRESIALIPKEGEQIDMGWGQKMYIRCLGEGLPTVILDAPTGGTSEVWVLVQQQLAKVSKVCVYDRAGLGFSDLPFFNEINQNLKSENRKFVSQVATLEQMTCDLHHLVTTAKPLPRPFILVGSEIGGLIARHYSLMYPEDVSDIVLLNPFVEDLFWRQKEDWNNYWNSQVLPTLGSLEFSAYTGVSRIAALIGWLKADMAGGSIPKEVELTQLSHMCNPYHMNAVFHEHFLLNTSFSQMNEVWKRKSFPKNVSITVINSLKFEKIPTQLQSAWQQSQLYLHQSLHPSCQYYMTDGSSEKLYKEPGIVASKVQKHIYQWRINNDLFPTIHTFHEQKSLPE